MRRNSCRRAGERGFSLGETLTALTIVGLILTLCGASLRAVVHSAGSAQAKTETVQTAAQVLYKVQRDLRESTIKSVYLCTYSASPACGSAANPVLAVATAEDAGGVIQLRADGTPLWQGFVVYWVANSTLFRSYQAVGGMSNPPGAADAAKAVGAANLPASPNRAAIAAGVASLTCAVALPPPNAVALTLVTASSKGGASNTTTFQTDVIPRNSY